MTGEIELIPGRVLGDTELVDNAKLNDLGRPVLRIKAGAVGTREMADGIITADKLSEDLTAQLGVADGSVSTAKIVDGAVTEAKLDPGVVGKLVAAGAVIQVGHYSYATYRETNAIIASTVDTVPSISNGAELFSTTFTPTFTNSRVLVRLVVPLALAGAATSCSFALFRGSTCLGVAAHAPAGGSYHFGASIEVLDLPNAITAQTYSVRFGTNAGNQLCVNGYSVYGGRIFGGAAAATITFTEIKG